MSQINCGEKELRFPEEKLLVFKYSFTNNFVEKLMRNNSAEKLMRKLITKHKSKKEIDLFCL